MQREDLINKIHELITPVLKRENLELFEIVLKRDSKGELFLRLLVDKSCGGINLEECTRLNEQISNILDTTDFLENHFILEVSSPGVDRPLAANKDFKRTINRDVRLFLSEPIDSCLELTGKIKEVKNGFLVLETKDKTIDVPFEIIVKGKQII